MLLGLGREVVVVSPAMHALRLLGDFFSCFCFRSVVEIPPTLL